jgi:hypothetical protein
MLAEFLKETTVIFCTLAFLLPLLNNYSIEVSNRPHLQHKHGEYPNEIL